MKAPYEYLKSDVKFSTISLKNSSSPTIFLLIFQFHSPSLYSTIHLHFAFSSSAGHFVKQLFPTYHEVTALNSSGCDLARLSQIGISHLFANSYWKLPVTYTFLQYKKGTCFHSIKFSLGKSASWRSIFGPCLNFSFSSSIADIPQGSWKPWVYRLFQTKVQECFFGWFPIFLTKIKLNRKGMKVQVNQ